MSLHAGTLGDIAGFPGDFDGFVGDFQRQNELNLVRMKAFHDRLFDLSKLYSDVRRDLERERIAGRHAQQHAEELEQKFRYLEESTARSAFALVLIDADADAYLFDEKYYDDPTEGGERAAVDLRAAVRQYLQSVDASLAGLPIIVKAFASGEGLAYLLSKAGMTGRADSQDMVSRFTRGFSQADDMIDFVLVGKGKDRADHKLMGAFRQFVESPSCRRVLLAGCHDNGYVRMLEKYAHNRTVADKVTLVKSFQTGSEFASLRFASTTMETVFRNRPLQVYGGPPMMPLTPMTPIATPSTTPITSPMTPVLAAQYMPMPTLDRMTPPPSLHRIETGQAREGSMPGTPTSTPARPASASSKTSNSNSPPPTYATRAAVPPCPPPPPARALPMFGTLDKDMILVNDDEHRIDCALPPKSAGAVDKLHQKTHLGGKRFCNMFHLYGSCAGCNYLHEPLSSAEKLVLRHRLRGEKCHDRGRCRDAKCFYGHHCSCPMSKKCHFPANMHNVDVSTWREVVAI